MSLAGKIFKNNVTGSTIKVIDSFENIAILENKQKIDVKTLMDSNQYTEQIDPSSFFNNQGAYNILAEKIKTIPSHMIQDEEGSVPVVSPSSYNEFSPSTNESAIIMGNEDDEKAELARKYGVSLDDNSLQKQNAAFAKLLGEEAENELPQVPVQSFNENIQRVEVQRDEVSRPIINEPVVEKRVEDPIVTMFKRTKRNVEFKINIEVSDKIPRLDFIEMMEDSYEISMIDFLADEFTNKILQDPSVIRETIKDKIKQLVYGGEITKSEPKINDQITDSVTQVNSPTNMPGHRNPPPPPADRIVKEGELPTKPKTTRKPRAKKEDSQK
jgi:hypothetical protein